MRYISLFSGIEAATQAWHPLGWRPLFFSEVDPFANAVLKHHYPEVTNLGDITQHADWPAARPDLVVGGSPCQGFSIAGLRRGLDDARSNLMLQFLRVVDRYSPRWVVWENVPGALSTNGGRDFGALLGGLAELGYGFAYRILDAQFTRTQRFPRAVPQSRRRVFVVGHSGGLWQRTAAVLLEPEGLCGDPPTREKTEQEVAGGVARSVAIRGREGTAHAELGNDVANAILTPSGGRAGIGVGAVLTNAYVPEVAKPIIARDAKGSPNSDCDGFNMVAHCLRADGFDASEDGTGRGTPIISFSCKDHGADAGEVSPTLRAMGHDKSHANAGGQVAVASRHTVRRLTPRECERLQAFPDDWTRIPWRNKPAEKCPDGPRYRCLGNSMAVNVMDWLGRRMTFVDKIENQ